MLAPGRGWAELEAALSSLSGPELKAEAGWHINQDWSAFVDAYANPQDQGVGIGMRWEW